MNVAPFEVPPPGVGLKTVTVAVPADAMSVAWIVAVRDVPEMKVVVRLAPFHRTLLLGLKFVPVTVSVKPGSPEFFVLGLMVVIVGMRFGMVIHPLYISPYTSGCPKDSIFTQ